MDLRAADFPTQIISLIDQMMSKINTSVPGVIEAFDESTQTATVIPALRTKVVIDDVASFIDAPPILNVPIVFPFASTKGFALTLPISKGDPCLLIFSQRAIDNWLESGGIQNTEEGVGARHHDLTDAVALLAPAPGASVLGSWEADGIELRNRAGTAKITLKDDSIVTSIGGASNGVVQGDCLCAFTGAPHPMVSATVKASV